MVQFQDLPPEILRIIAIELFTDRQARFRLLLLMLKSHFWRTILEPLRHLPEFKYPYPQSSHTGIRPIYDKALLQEFKQHRKIVLVTQALDAGRSTEDHNKDSYRALEST